MSSSPAFLVLHVGKMMPRIEHHINIILFGFNSVNLNVGF